MKNVPAILQAAANKFHEGDLRGALQLYDKALTIERRNPIAHCNRGNVFNALGKPQEALDSYERAISLNPGYALAYCNRGAVLRELKQLAGALESYNRAILLNPDFASAYVNRAHLLIDLERVEDALADTDKAISLQPQSAAAYTARGNAFLSLGQPAVALENYERALLINPAHLDATINQAEAHKALGQLEAALAFSDRAIALQPDQPRTRANRALILLALGRYEQGWREYEWRWLGSGGQEIGQAVRHGSRPRWSGRESLTGKAILVHAEQGLGDTIQFSRYSRLLHEAGARVILEVPETLASLMASVKGVSEIVPWGGRLPHFDFRCPLLSLPHALGTTLENIPVSDSYVAADPAKVARWSEKLASMARPRIGLVWSVNQSNRLGLHRSIPLASLLAHLPGGYTYVSLQKEIREQDAPSFASSARLMDCRDDLSDFGETAALCQCLDLLISVDTSVAHLGGALGIPTWILLPFNGDWRWLQGRDDSPWYPSVRLFRRNRLGDWSGPLQRLSSEILEKYSPQ